MRTVAAAHVVSYRLQHHLTSSEFCDKRHCSRFTMSGLVLCLMIVELFATSVLHANGSTVSPTNKAYNERLLYQYIMEGYIPSIRPVEKESDAVDLYLEMRFQWLEDLDEVNQAVLTTGWMYMTWKDFQLSWKPEEFGNITETRIPISKIWYPDITVVNSLDASKPNTQQMVIVTSDGNVRWFPTMNLRTYCPMDLTRFPFDEHRCTIKITSWSYDESKINLTTMTSEISSYMPVGSAEWELWMLTTERNSKKYACCPETYVDITFNMLLRRKPTFASHLFVAPSVILCLITSSVFILPPASFEKLTLGTGIMIGHILLLGELINFVPSAHPTVPLIGKFFVSNIVMVSLSLVVSAVVLNLWNRSKSRCVGPPTFCRTILMHWLVVKVLLIDFDDYDDGDLGLSSFSAGPGSEQAGKLEVMTDIAVSDSNMSATDDRARIIDQTACRSAKTDWRRLAVVIDRLSFIIFAIVLIVTCFAFSGYM